MKYLVIIPARGGSKGIPNKNIIDLGGKPLISYTVKEALSLFSSEDICVSTDDNKIMSVVTSLGLQIPFSRPASLATDTASSRDVLVHAINHYQDLGNHYDAIILLQPTSPFRTSKHIKDAISIYESSNDIDMVVSVKESKSNPYFNLFEEDENLSLKKSKHSSVTRRQDVPTVYEYNGALYIIKVDSLLSRNDLNFSTIKKYVMSDEDSYDIDTPLDLQISRFLIQER